MRFKNLKTGNIVSTENKDTIALMKKSANYEEVKTTKKGKTSETGNDEGKAEE